MSMDGRGQGGRPRHPAADSVESTIDRAIGAQIRTIRTLRGLSQEELGQRLGLSFQQIQKYEAGSDRVSSSRLFQLSQILEADIAGFYDLVDDPDAVGRTASEDTVPTGTARDTNDARLLRKRETLELIRAYFSIRDEALKTKLREIIDTLADRGGDDRTASR